MGTRYRSSVCTLATTIKPIHVDIWVAYDEAHGGYYVAAKVVEVTPQGMVISYMSGEYEADWLVSDCKRGSAKKLEQARVSAETSIQDREGIAWDAVSRLCVACGLEIKPPGVQVGSDIHV